MQKEISITIPVTIDKTKIESLLISGLEQGIHYWAEIGKRFRPKKGKARDEIYMHDYVMDGGYIMIVDTESEMQGEGHHEYKLDLAAVEDGLKILAEKYPHHMADIIKENDDMNTADALIQCALLKDIIYG